MFFISQMSCRSCVQRKARMDFNVIGELFMTTDPRPEQGQTPQAMPLAVPTTFVMCAIPHAAAEAANDCPYFAQSAARPDPVGVHVATLMQEGQS